MGGANTSTTFSVDGASFDGGSVAAAVVAGGGYSRSLLERAFP
jgi:hypothetical protein